MQVSIASSKMELERPVEEEHCLPLIFHFLRPNNENVIPSPRHTCTRAFVADKNHDFRIVAHDVPLCPSRAIQISEIGQASRNRSSRALHLRPQKTSQKTPTVPMFPAVVRAVPPGTTVRPRLSCCIPLKRRGFLWAMGTSAAAS